MIQTIVKLEVHFAFLFLTIFHYSKLEIAFFPLPLTTYILTFQMPLYSFHKSPHSVQSGWRHEKNGILSFLFNNIESICLCTQMISLILFWNASRSIDSQRRCLSLKRASTFEWTWNMIWNNWVKLFFPINCTFSFAFEISLKLKVN